MPLDADGVETSLYQAAYQLNDQSGLERIAPFLKQNLAYAITLESSPAQEYTFPLGASRLGGTPDLPPGLAWPMWQGEPMIFLAQINLSDVAPYDVEHQLPSHGWLAFFCMSQDFELGYDLNGWAFIGPREFGSWKALYFEGTSADLQSIPAPISLMQAGHLLAPCTLRFRTTVTLPNRSSLLIESLALNEGEFDQYLDLSKAYSDRFRSSDDIWHWHQLLGHPEFSQSEMELTCHLASIGLDYNEFYFFDKAAKAAIYTQALDWICLFHLDTDEYAKVSWGEYGSLVFWIKRLDLEKHTFDGCWASSDSM